MLYYCVLCVLLWCIIVVYYCGVLLLCVLLWCIIVVYYCGVLLWCIIVVYYCGGIVVYVVLLWCLKLKANINEITRPKLCQTIKQYYLNSYA